MPHVPRPAHRPPAQWRPHRLGRRAKSSLPLPSCVHFFAKFSYAKADYHEPRNATRWELDIMKILIAPGAFKHSLTARAAAEAIARGIQRSGQEAELVLLPIADGGNGTLDAFLAGGGQRIQERVVDPLGRPLLATYGMLNDGGTA